MPILAMILGAIGGVLGMFFFDPNTGKRRRSQARDQVAQAKNRAPDMINAVSKQVQNRAKELAATAQKRLHPEVSDDEQLAARVRSEMEHHVSHPKAITVSAYQGEVTVSGAILTHEAPGLISAIQAVPGVKLVHNYLVHYEHAENVPDLQGDVTHPEMG
jgi:osmotically-inducible protein OsmY